MARRPRRLSSAQQVIVFSHSVGTVPRLARAAWVAVIAALSVVAPASKVRAQAFAAKDSHLAEPARGQVSSSEIRRIASGERARYELRLAGREVGSGSLEVLGEESLNGHPTLHTRLEVSGGVLFAKVDDRFDSWIDPSELFSRRFVQNQKELTKTRHREYEMAPERRTFRETSSGDESALSSDRPLDDVSFLFYARSLPLHVGDVDTIPRYFKPGHDVILRVLRKERITVPAGTFETIVVQPTITNAGGLFGQGGQAEVYFSDDAARTLVMLKSKVPVVGSISLHLKDFRSAQ
jgi:hypothetical protein